MPRGDEVRRRRGRLRVMVRSGEVAGLGGDGGPGRHQRWGRGGDEQRHRRATASGVGQHRVAGRGRWGGVRGSGLGRWGVRSPPKLDRERGRGATEREGGVGSEWGG